MKPLRRDLRLWAIVAAAAYPGLDAVLPTSLQSGPYLVKVLVYAVLGLGLHVVTGMTGLLNLGAAGFMAVGAYAFAILTCAIYPFQLGFWGGTLGAIFAATGVGVLVAMPTLRLRGDYLAIVTLGFGEIIQDLLRNLFAITKGTQGIGPPLPNPGIGPYQIGDGWRAWYWSYLAIVAITATLLAHLERSRFGRAWIAIREDELAARAMGIDVPCAKLGAFALGAALCGLAGALYACQLDTSSEPGTYDFQTSIMGLSIVIIGGMGSLRGALIGALVIGGFNALVLDKLAEFLARRGLSSTANVLTLPGNWKYLVFGLALILMMRFRPEGILPSRRRRAELAGASAAGEAAKAER